MNWGNLGGGQGTFRFGPLSGVQQSLYENQPDLAYQKFTDWFGGGNPGFNNTVLGRWLAQQQQPMNNRFIAQQAENPTAGLTWTNFLEQQANGGQLGQQFAMLPQYMRGTNPGLYRNRRELW